MHYYKKNIGDYAKKAGRLSMLEHGAYTLLLDSCYDREQFPTEQEAIDWCWARTEAEIAAVRFVLSKFFTLEDGRYVQKRVNEELALYHAKAAKNAEIAKDREQKRKDKARNVNETCTTDHEAPPNHKPITNNHKPINTTAAIIPPVVATTDENPSPPPPVVGKPEKPEPPPKPEVARNVQIAVLLREWERDRGKFAKITSATPQLQGWIYRGASNDQIREAYDLAVAMRSSNGDEGAINAGIVDTFLAQILNPPAATSALNRHPPPGTVVPWQASWSGIVAKGQELGMHQSEAEHPQAFKARVFEAAQMTPEEKAVLRADYGVHA